MRYLPEFVDLIYYKIFNTGNLSADTKQTNPGMHLPFKLKCLVQVALPSVSPPAECSKALQQQVIQTYALARAQCKEGESDTT